jgi:hypothetical protein
MSASQGDRSKVVTVWALPFASQVPAVATKWEYLWVEHMGKGRVNRVVWQVRAD